MYWLFGFYFWRTNHIHCLPIVVSNFKSERRADWTEKKTSCLRVIPIMTRTGYSPDRVDLCA